MRWLVVALLTLLACHREAQPTIGNHAGSPPTADAAEPDAASPCVEYDAAVTRALACTALTPALRHQIEQDQTDTHASIAENGLDGSHISPDEECETQLHALEHQVARPCGW